jgi:hypothetical protein
VEEKDALDEHYVQHASLFLDLSILLRTAWVMFRGDVRNEVVIAAALAEKRQQLRSEKHAESEKESAVPPQEAAFKAAKSKRFVPVAKIDVAKRPLLMGSRKKRA